MMTQLGRQHAFSQHLLELPGQAIFPKDRLGVVVLNLGKQLVDQLDREWVRCLLFLGLFRGHYFGHGTVLSGLFHDPVPHRKSDRLAKRYPHRFLQLGQPQQNAYVERYNRTVHYDWLAHHLFETLDEIQEFATNWLWTYNHDRPNVALAA